LREGFLKLSVVEGGDEKVREEVEREVKGLGDGILSGFSGGGGDFEERGEVLPTRYMKLLPLGDDVYRWGTKAAVYEYVATPESELGLLIGRVGRGASFEIRLAKLELAIKWYAYGREDEDFIGKDGEPLPETFEKMKALPPLTHRKGTSVGRCLFKTVRRLSWPPRSITEVGIIRSSPEDIEDVNISEWILSTHLRITVSHISAKPLTLQTSGHQHYLFSESRRYGLLADYMYWPRIIHKTIYTTPPRLYHAIRVKSLATNEVVFGGVPNQVCRLRDMRPPVDWRPRRMSLVTIPPGYQLVREVPIDAVLEKLEDGQYELRVEPLRMWWCQGELGEDEDGSGKVPQKFWRKDIPLARLEAQPVKFRVVDGKLDG
jgi:hypothetical protein